MRWPFCVLLLASSLLPRAAHAYHDEEHGLLDDTAHTLKGGELRLGLFEQNLGLHRYVQIGTETLPWVVGVFLRSVTPNLNAKVGLVRSRGFDASLRASVFYAHVAASGSEAEGSGSLWIVPVSLTTSTRLLKPLWVHTEATGTWIGAGGRAEAQSLSVRGAALARSVQFGLMLEARVNRVLAFTLRGRMETSTRPTLIRSRSEEGAVTQLDADVTIAPRFTHPPMVGILGVALSWKHFNLQLGMGYGNLFLPSLRVPIPGAYPVPDGSLFFRF